MTADEIAVYDVTALEPGAAPLALETVERNPPAAKPARPLPTRTTQLAAALWAGVVGVSLLALRGEAWSTTTQSTGRITTRFGAAQVSTHARLDVWGHSHLDAYNAATGTPLLLPVDVNGLGSTLAVINLIAAAVAAIVVAFLLGTMVRPSLNRAGGHVAVSAAAGVVALWLSELVLVLGYRDSAIYPAGADATSTTTFHLGSSVAAGAAAGLLAILAATVTLWAIRRERPKTAGAGLLTSESALPDTQP